MPMMHSDGAGGSANIGHAATLGAPRAPESHHTIPCGRIWELGSWGPVNAACRPTGMDEKETKGDERGTGQRVHTPTAMDFRPSLNLAFR